MTIGINCGHTIKGTVGAGAVGYLNESDETRAVGYALMRMLRSQGETVIDCTDDNAATVSGNLRAICALANAQPLDMFLSIHFNAGGGRGCEAYTYDGKDVAHAGEMLEALSGIGFQNRGIKNGSRLYVVRNTVAPAVLLEVCFVDTQSDAELYKKLSAEKVAAAICGAITGKTPNVGGNDFTMEQYEELKRELTDLTETVKILAAELAELKSPMIYNYIDENMPVWAKPTIQKLVDMDALRGDDNGLGLTEDMLRMFVVNDRAGAYDL